MKGKYILLINDKQAGTVCWNGEGTVAQVKSDIEELVGSKRISPDRLEVIPVIGSRPDPWKIGVTVLGLMGLAGFVAYENLRKRARKRRKHSNS
jgi:hypothetical protein